MHKIVTITFSPCIDKSTSIPALVPEKKLRCSEPRLEPGGGGINVARAIIKLGGKAIAVYPSGGYTGKFFNYLMHEEDVPSEIIECKNETRENIIILDEGSNKQYRFGMPGTILYEPEWKQCLTAIEHIHDTSFIVASGSLPPGVPLDIYAQLSRIAKKKNAKLIVDTSGEALKHAIDEGVYMIKPNLGELASLAGISKIEDNDIEQVAREVMKNSECKLIAVSMGKSGALLISEEKTYKVVPPEVESKSTVGAGDSMVAGFVYSLSHEKDLEEALQFGVACGTAATMNAGTELFTKEDAHKLFHIMSKK